jgi:hypothetical protein
VRDAQQRALQAVQAQAALGSSDEEQREVGQPLSALSMHSGSTLYSSPSRAAGSAHRASEQLWSRSFSANGFACKLSAAVQASVQPGCEPVSRLLVLLECCAAVGDELLAVPSARLGLALEVTSADGSFMSWGEEGAEEGGGSGGAARLVEQAVCCVVGEEEVAAEGAGVELAQLVQQGGELRVQAAVTVA